jgi:hypothetical protein
MNTENQLFAPNFDDFSIAEPVTTTKFASFPGLYAFFDADGDCLYVGQSISVHTRIIQHRKKIWYKKADNVRVLRLPDEQSRLIRETVLCLAFSPAANRAIKLGKRADGTWHECQFLPFKGSKRKVNP